MKGLSRQHTTCVYNSNWILLSKRMDFKWISRVFDDGFTKVKRLHSLEVTHHPLEKHVIVVTNRKSSTPNVTGNKAMTTTTSWGGLDPLSDPLGGLRVDDSHSEVEDEVVLKWPTFRARVLSKFKVDQKIAIKSSFLSIGKSSNSSGPPASTSSSVADQVRQRLQTIDEGSSSVTSGEMISLTQEEFTSRMNQMNELLLESWSTDQRVKSLKIVIQITKILTEIPSVSFYPSQFMLIVDILDSFGSLVSSRITSKMNESTMNASSQEAAIETAKNWFYKVSSIRELIPRFFIEISILKIYKFVFTSKQIMENLSRLSTSVNGISHPIVSMYARCYLVKAVTELAMNDAICYPRHSIQRMIVENVRSISSLSAQVESSIELKKNHTVLSPPLDWMVNSFKAMKGDQSLLLGQLDSFSKSLSCILLKSILDHCSNRLIESSHHHILHFILDTDGSDFPLSDLIVSFGKRVSSVQSEVSVKRRMVSDIWKKMGGVPLLDYLTCASAWIQFVVVNLTREESGIVLCDLVKRTTSAGSEGDFSNLIDPPLLTIVKSVTESTSSTLLITRSLVPLLHLIHKSEYKVEACKLLIQYVIQGVTGDGSQPVDESHDNGFDHKSLSDSHDNRFGSHQKSLSDSHENGSDHETLKSESHENGSDHETLKSLYSLCKLLAHSIDLMTIEDEKRSISALIIASLRVILLNPLPWVSEEGLESQLDLLMESRSDFVDLDQVTAFLVHASNSLTVQCLVQGKKSMTRYLIQSCLAYSYITIPSLSDHHVQLQLFLNSAQVSLLTASLSQTDSFLKSAITLLNTLPPGYETNDGRMVSFDDFFLDYSSNLLSLLILVPDHPDHDTIYLAKALHTVVTSRQMADPGHRIPVLLNFIAYISWTRQDKLPFHVPGGEWIDWFFLLFCFFLSDYSLLFCFF